MYVVWFICDCVMVKDWFHRVLRLSTVFQDSKRGCAQISAHPCESAASTSDGHKIPV